MGDTADNKMDLEAMSFEQAMGALEQVVAKLESGNASLEQSIELYTRGTALKAHCEAKLKDAQAKIEKITLDSAGNAAGTAPLDVE
ncbi:exodeoxyribonuclease VII small subunit [Kordiimonas sp.]|uniref:exodeoxyribonuclease VII small subunit n=1 Tax=Kordiimonas sp. TaxID=1970157 RepID=UPI003A93BAE2